MSDLNTLASVHKLQYEIHSDCGAEVYKDFINDVWKAATDARRATKAFSAFTD